LRECNKYKEAYNMNVGNITSGAASALWANTLQSSSPARSSSKSAAESATQEALETAAVTKAEAAKGDAQALRKLARSEAAKNPQPVEQPVASTDNTGKTLNVLA
jgi:hypothetical protein